MGTIGVEITESAPQPRRQIVVEEQLHAAMSDCFSRSAA